MKKAQAVSAGVAFLLAINFSLHAQTTAISIQSIRSASVNDLNTMLEAVEATTPVPAESVPKFGVFISARLPSGPPLPGSMGWPAWNLGEGVWLLNDLDQAQGQMRAMAMDVPTPGDGGNDGGSNNYSNFASSYTIDTNSLWLEITNVSNGLAYLNLHNSTDEVYEVWSKIDLLVTNWNIEQEIWPEVDQEPTPFTVPMLDRTNLFIWARDWTGITSGGNVTPEWWFWKYFGTVDLSDTNLDSQGNALLYDYQNGVDPNVISFSILFTNTLVNSSLVQGTVAISGGVPFYWAVLINDDHAADADWQPYTSSNLQVNLNAGDGNYAVWVGLRGLPADAQQTWLERSITLDTTPPVLMVTNPMSGVVSQPMIQLQGYANEALSSLTFDVSNALGVITNQPGYVTGQFYNTNLRAFTTNWFECYDIAPTNGLNTITLHATDLAGNLTTAAYNFTLDYTSDTTPPALTLIWPQDGTAISGSQCNLRAQVDDDTATVTVAIVDANGNTNIVQGLVERSGLVWVNNLPVATGANTLTITATDAAGNTSTTNIVLMQSSVTVTLNPLTSDQLNQLSVTVTGTINDPSYDVWVNGIEAYYVDDAGDWEADGVPVSPTGTATFDVEIYSTDSSNLVRNNSRFTPLDDTPGGNNIGSQVFNQAQPVMVILSAYSATGHNDEPTSWHDDTATWAYDSGGNWDDESAYQGTILTIAQPPRSPRPLDASGWVYYNNGGGIGPDGAGFTSPEAENLGPFTPAWENAALSAPMRSIKTTVMLVPSGPAVAGATALYLVTAKALELSDPAQYNNALYLSGGYAGNVPLPPEWLQINGQTLINTGQTNSDGTVLGAAIVEGPAGMPLPLKMTATRVHQYNDYTWDGLQATNVTIQSLTVVSNSATQIDATGGGKVTNE
jgi:hypothetical protein